MREGMFSMGLELSSQILAGCRGHGDDATKRWCRLIEDEGLPGPVADRAPALLYEQDSGCEIPFVLRFDGEGSLDTTGCDQSQCIGDRVHGATRSGLGEARPSFDPKLPRVDHDGRIESMRGRKGDACAVPEQSASAHGREEFVGG